MSKRKIVIRDDDVLIGSSQFKDPIGRFRGYHKQVVDNGGNNFIHVPAILVTEIQRFPDVIPFIRNEAEAGRMRPELHGLRHDFKYDKMDCDELESHMDQCVEWMQKNLGVTPTKFYTPHGAHPTTQMYIACGKYGIEPVDCTEIIKPASLIERIKREGVGPWMHDREVFTHWWERGTRVSRLMLAYNYGDYDEAAKNHPEWFGK